MIACNCTGIRFCAQCVDSPRVQALLHGDVPLHDAATVITHQQSSERTSSCSFALIGESTHHLCIECCRIFHALHAIERCADHDGCALADGEVGLHGVFVTPDFISVEEEQRIVCWLDDPTAPFPSWKESQSGRRKQEYGPQKNFKKKKVTLTQFVGMPNVFRDVFARIESTVTQRTNGVPYAIAEASALEYRRDKMSNIDPHVDDTWLWGDRIVGVNLLERCSMTFVNKNALCVEVGLPPRCLFVMSGESRYEWMHAIRPQSVAARRISITLRELAPSFIAAQPAVADGIATRARTFV